jgi:LuxR family transcriptional regulator, maltose regulon positive regulatory protein
MRLSVIPRPARCEVTRSALLTRLADTLDVPLVVLSAPSGYGKTTLLAQYARSTPRRVVWCRLGEAEVGVYDVAQLIAQNAAPLIGADPALSHPEQRTPGEVLAQRLGTAFSQLNDNVDLIIDHVESVTVARWLIQLAGALDEGHRLLFSCYTTEGLRLARRVADGSGLIIDAVDLKLSADEVRYLLEARDVTLDPAVTAQLEGWPAGVALAASGSHRQVQTRDLIQDTLDLLPAEVRDHLAEVAVLDLWSEAEAQNLGSALKPGWLAQVQRVGLPMVPLGQQTYQPHRLLTELLERQLQADPPRARRFGLVAARQAEVAGERRRAVRLYTQAQAFTDAVRLAGELVDHHRNRSEHRLTRQLLETLPPEQLGAELQARLAWAYIETGDTDRGEALLLTLHQAGRLTPAGYASLAMVYGRRGDPALQYHYATTGLAHLGPGEEVPALFWPLVQAALRQGYGEVAQDAATRFLTWAQTQGDQIRVAEALQLQAAVYRQTQQLLGAQAALRQARTVYDTLGWTVRAAAIRLDEADLALRCGEVEAAQAALDEAEQCFDADHHVYQVKRLLLRATLARWSGQLTEAERCLNLAEDHARAGQLNPGNAGLPLARIDLLIDQQRLDEARLHLARLAVGSGAHELAHARLLRTLLLGEPLELDEVRTWLDTEQRLRGLWAMAGPNAHDPLRQEVQASPLARLVLAGQAGGSSGPSPMGPPILSDTGPHPFPAEAPAATLPVLQITALGDCAAVLAGQPLNIALAKSRELLVWLALYGSGSRDELVTALWDGSAEERHIEYLRVAIRRLRSALRLGLPPGHDPLPFAQGRYRLSSELSVTIDAQPEALFNDSAPPGEVFAAHRRAFLPGTETLWAQEVRQTCLRRAVELGLTWAAQLLDAVPVQALGVYRQVLQLEPWSDAAHQGLIRGLLLADQRGEADQALREYRALLRREFGLSLDPAFERSLTAQGLERRS